MTEIKNVLFHLTNEEHAIATKYKDTHNKPTWKEMMMDYIAIKNAEEEIGD